MTEADIMRQMQIDASKLGARLFRQNTGLAWVGEAEVVRTTRTILARPGDVVIRNGRAFHAGFKGMSDLGGWVPITVTHEMAGLKLAVYTQVEVKKNGRVTSEQTNWIDAVKAAGGRAGVVRTADDLASILR